MVTGGAGFIGSNLVRRLLEQGDSVVVVDDLSTGHLGNIDGLPIDFVEGSILDSALLENVSEGVSAIVHLAALGSVPRSVANPLASHAANATGTVMVCELARRLDCYLVAASSSSVYGSVPSRTRVETLPTRPRSPYAASKLATEGYVLAYGASYGLETLPFRFFNVYGPRQAAGHAYAAVIPAFIDAALAGRPLRLEGDGLQSRDFTFVDTVTGVIAQAVHNRVTSQSPVNLALGDNVSLLELIDELQKLLGKELSIERFPERAGDVRSSQADPGLLNQLFPTVSKTSFPVGLEATLRWYEEMNLA